MTDSSSRHHKQQDEHNHLSLVSSSHSSISKEFLHVDGGGIGEQLFTTHILIYLNMTELCAVSQASKFFHRASQVSFIWESLLEDDFRLPLLISATTASDTISTRNGATGTDNLSAKAKYAQRLRERNQCYQQAQEAATRTKVERKRSLRVRTIQKFLDATQFKIMIPLPIITLFVSIILTCLYFDGFDVPVWSCAAPLLFYFVYLLLSMAVACYVYQQQSNAASVLEGLWQDMRGPLKSVYTDALRETPKLAIYGLIIVLICAIQVVLVTLKIYFEKEAPESSLYVSMGWAVTFTPIWLLFILYCIAPLIGCFHGTRSNFIPGLLFVWVPLLIFLICLTVKLTAEENHQPAQIRLALILLPFWCIEGLAMLSSLGYMLLGFHYWRRGFLDSGVWIWGCCYALLTAVGCCGWGEVL